jgi:hypothetical protein
VQVRLGEQGDDVGQRQGFLIAHGECHEVL